jgi:hypothetical protein
VLVELFLNVIGAVLYVAIGKKQVVKSYTNFVKNYCIKKAETSLIIKLSILYSNE